MEFSNLFDENEVSAALQFLIMDSIIYLLFALYLNAVLPKEFGTRKPLYFPVTELFGKFQQRKRRNGSVNDTY